MKSASSRMGAVTLNPHCGVCDDKRYLVNERSDGREAVERCDHCSVWNLTDMQAAKLAQSDGIKCEGTYPCYLLPRDTRTLTAETNKVWFGEDGTETE